MAMDYLHKLVESMNFPENIPAEEIEAVIKRRKTVRLNKNEFFLKAGEVPRHIGYVVAGLMRLYYINTDGVEITKHFCMENTLAISYSAFLLREGSSFYIQALEDTELYVFDYDTYRDLLAGHACWQSVAKKLSDLLFIIKEKREAELLLCNAQERYGRFLKDYPNLEKRLNQYHIASYLGITPESLSRIRANFMES